ncbi:MAG TPA: DNA replication/repair protein RecF [Firmicutes bacterium]|nr:DNA replication/repair protein RecF [Bacillota bacterium]HHY97375.1 DNA replication/repair protein RecF [Bacillota bacterium]
MAVERIFIYNFRNYEKLDLEIEGAINLFLGNNAQGKTNLLEALEMAVTSRSHRTSRDAELIKWGAQGYYIKAKLRVDHTTAVVEIGYSSDKGRAIRVDGQIVRGANGFFPGAAVVFSPDDLSLIKGTPALRRKYLDSLAVQVNPGFQAQLSAFQRILFQRNSILKHGEGMNDVVLGVWDEQLAARAAKVINGRMAVLRELRPLVQEEHKRLGNNKDISMSYDSSLGIHGNDQSIDADTILERILEAREDDRVNRYTTVGPHRDDLIVTVDGTDLRVYGSQGQQRAAVLALKLAEVRLLERAKEYSPILLLDDVFSELDTHHRQALARAMGDCSQAFITATDLDSLPNEIGQASIYYIHDGSVGRG